jgi:TolA-binding protein
MSRYASRILFIFGLAASAAPAQAPRAQVVEDDPPAQTRPMPRAVPLGPPGTPVQRATVVEDETPLARPAVPVARPPGPDEDLYEYAMLAYGQKEYSMASKSFDQYLSSYPTGRHAADALFRLGECYLNQGQQDEAGRCYREVVNRFPKAVISPYAALRLGVLRYNAEDFKAATTFFNFCESKSTVQALTLQAAYYRSLAHSRLSETTKQIDALKVVVAVKKDNEFLQDALLNLATAYQTAGKNKEALPILKELAADSPDQKVRADASVKAAVLLSEQAKPDEAAEYYKQVLVNGLASVEQRGAALFGIVSGYYASGDYEAVVDTYNRNAHLSPPPDLRARMMLTVGNALRGKKSYARAIDLYNMVEQYHSEHPAAYEAAYWRVYCFYLLEDKSLEQSIRAFLDRFATVNKGHEFINTARLLLADHYFNQQKYPEAATAYADLQLDKLTEKVLPSTLYHKGWSESEAVRHTEAIVSLSAFIKGSPESPDLPKALAKRGLSAKETNDFKTAIDDFARIVKEYPTNEAVELAYYLSGLIHEKQNNKKDMQASFEALLKNFPSSAAAAEVSYKLGVAYADQKNFDKAVTLLKQSIKLDATTYGDLATQRVLLCYWAKEDLENLSREVDDYRGAKEDAVIPPTMLGFLGLRYFDRKDYDRASRYLTWASTPDAPDNTDLRIWNYLAQSKLEVKDYEEGVKAADHFLSASPDNLPKARGYETKARLLIGTGRFDEAIMTAGEGLNLSKDGDTQGLLLLAQGDAFLAAGDKLEVEGNAAAAKEKWQKAVEKYIVPSQTLDDPVITPKALSKSIQALDRLGDAEKAEKLRKQLKTSYPDFKAE